MCNYNDTDILLKGNIIVTNARAIAAPNNRIKKDTGRALFKYKQKITSQTGNYGTKYVQILPPLKCLSNLWRTLDISLINCETNIILTWSE